MVREDDVASAAVAGAGAVLRAASGRSSSSSSLLLELNDENEILRFFVGGSSTSAASLRNEDAGEEGALLGDDGTVGRQVRRWRLHEQSNTPRSLSASDIELAGVGDRAGSVICCLSPSVSSSA